MRLSPCHYKPIDIQLHIIGTCQLKCEYCAKDIFNDYMDLETFKRVVDKCVAFGFKRFELTPTVGDLLLDPELEDKFVYLDSKPIENIFFFTNLLNLNKDIIEILNRTKKLNIRISLYGDSPVTYKRYTNVDKFNTFIDNLYILSHNMRRGLVGEFNIRYEGWSNKNLYKLTNPLYRTLYGMILAGKITEDQIVDDSYNDNWNEVVEQGYELDHVEHRERDGVCRFAVISNSVLPNGDITLCGCIDTQRKMIIGNLFKQSLNEIYGYDSLYHRILHDQTTQMYRGMCIDCTMYDIFNKQGEYVYEEED